MKQRNALPLSEFGCRQGPGIAVPSISYKAADRIRQLLAGTASSWISPTAGFEVAP
jgi:hypothetical protein